MTNDKITTLAELRQRKAMLKRELESGFENPFTPVKQLLGKYASGSTSPMAFFDKNEEGRNQLMDEGVKAVLTLVASTAVTRFRLGPVPKLLLTAGVAMATPYVVDKIQNYIHKKMN
ncbi:MAG: hypothetical protein Q4G27_06010 [Flavobacteriaceae bacterium]|nr:hypothetical protein [Flavobacteriaceae bacterium]